jgi:glucose/mannose-6-phosphate isomerase
MDKLIAAFPKNIDEALTIAKNSTFQTPNNEIKNVVICGMGGSGIGGKLVSYWVQDEISVPVQCFHDYTAPAFINKHTLVIASSYSGNTEETLIFVEQAREKGAHIIGVCSGGELKSYCSTHSFDCIVVPGGNPPRTALAFSIVQVTNILYRLNLISDTVLKNLASAKELIETENTFIKTEALQLAEFLKGSVPVFYATTFYDAVLIRAKQQFNENSKVLCWTHVIPEMNHNELVGWGGGDNRFAAVYFDTKDLLPRNEKRVEITCEVVAAKTKLLTIEIKGNNLIERSIYMINLVDWSSFYLSEIKQEDAMEIKIIDRLKSELANFQDK